MTEAPLLTLRSIGKRFPGVIALDRVDFTVRAGETFDVALLDLHMEPMDGVSLAAALRRLRPKPPTPVIILSSVGAAEKSRTSSRCRPTTAATVMVSGCPPGRPRRPLSVAALVADPAVFDTVQREFTSRFGARWLPPL